MELILKSNDKQSLARIIDLAKKLNVVVEQKDTDTDKSVKDVIRDRILNFKAKTAPSIDDAERWQREQRTDRDLPLS